MLYANIILGEWTAPLGPHAFRPTPVGTYAFSKFDKNRALMFGGFGPRGRVNEAFIFEFEDRVSSLVRKLSL